jgi:hypothetical protein
MIGKRRKATSGPPRSEVFGMRLDPKLKYLTEIAARRQRRSIANFIEWAIQQALKLVKLFDRPDSPSIWDYSNDLWHIEAPDRLGKLAFLAPDLLSYDEQLQWDLISGNTYFWSGDWKIDKTGMQERFYPKKKDAKSLNWEHLREQWETIQKVASGELTADAIPEGPSVRKL